MTTQTKRSSTRNNPRKANKAARPKPRATKRARLIKLLKGPKGADVAAISQKLGWQKHTTRAALTGLRKAGFVIERMQSDGGGASSYRITSEPQAMQVK